MEPVSPGVYPTKSQKWLNPLESCIVSVQLFTFVQDLQEYMKAE